MGEPKKTKKKSGNSSIRSPSSKKSGTKRKASPSSTASGPTSRKGEGKAAPEKKGARKYTESEKLSVCILYEFLKSTDKVAESCGMEGSSVRYIVKNNKTLRARAQAIVQDECVKEAEEFAAKLKKTATDAIEKLLGAVVDDTAIGKSNSQQLAIAMATLMDKFSLVPGGEEKSESGGVIILPEVEKG